MRADDLAPDFVLVDQDGETRTLSGLLAEGPVVLFFYPAALSPGCTRESCHFRDLVGEFAALGASVVGISMDEVATQDAFARRHHLGYPLLSDPDGRVAEVYGVKRSLGFLRVKRTTFVIGPDRRILAVVASEVSMSAHADRALEALRQRAA
ncbi:MAG: peroxiredoxin [Acidimicrobiales bacterium]